MRSISPLFDDAVIDCVATDRAPTVQELFHVAERIWEDGAVDRSVFRWGRLAATDPDKLMALRAAQVALLGVLTDQSTQNPPTYSAWTGSFNFCRFGGLGWIGAVRDPGLRPKPILLAIARRTSE